MNKKIQNWRAPACYDYHIRYFDALVLLRCFLLNGELGLVFGWLYRKYGIQYAMIGHAGRISSPN